MQVCGRVASKSEESRSDPVRGGGERGPSSSWGSESESERA